MICPKCKQIVNKEDAFCDKCGFKLSTDDANAKTTANKITELSHESVKEIAAAYNHNSLSPLAALEVTGKSHKKLKLSIGDELLKAISKPSKTFSLICNTNGKLYQKILMVKDTSCYRWVDQDGIVTINEEKRPRDFLGQIYHEISQNISSNEKFLIDLTREQIVILKGIYSLCQAIALLKAGPVFTTLNQLKSLINFENELKDHLGILQKKNLIKLTGANDLIITMETRGDEIVTALDDYEAFYNLQVLTEDRNDFTSLYLIARNGKLYMISNPESGDDVIFRNIDKADLKSLINWLWITDLYPEAEADTYSESKLSVESEPEDAIKKAKQDATAPKLATKPSKAPGADAVETASPQLSNVDQQKAKIEELKMQQKSDMVELNYQEQRLEAARRQGAKSVIKDAQEHIKRLQKQINSIDKKLIELDDK